MSDMQISAKARQQLDEMKAFKAPRAASKPTFMPSEVALHLTARWLAEDLRNANR